MRERFQNVERPSGWWGGPKFITLVDTEEAIYELRTVSIGIHRNKTKRTKRTEYKGLYTSLPYSRGNPKKVIKRKYRHIYTLKGTNLRR